MRTITLTYVIRYEVSVPVIRTTLEAGHTNYMYHRSLEDGQTSRDVHTHPLCRCDNDDVYYKLEESTRITAYADYIKQFQRVKEGQSEWLALTIQYGRDDN